MTNSVAGFIRAMRERICPTFNSHPTVALTCKSHNTRLDRPELAHRTSALVALNLRKRSSLCSCCWDAASCARLAANMLWQRSCMADWLLTERWPCGAVTVQGWLTRPLLTSPSLLRMTCTVQDLCTMQCRGQRCKACALWESSPFLLHDALRKCNEVQQTCSAQPGRSRDALCIDVAFLTSLCYQAGKHVDWAHSHTSRQHNVSFDFG